MIDVALCMLALIAGGVSLELFSSAVADRLPRRKPELELEFECGNPS